MNAVASDLDRSRLVRAALGTAMVFAVSGFLLGSWVSRLPAIRDRLDASATELGLALLAPGLGSLASMPLTGRLCRRFGSRAVVAVTSVGAACALALLGLAASLPALAVTLLLLGLLYGAWDVAMNVHGSGVEQRAGRAWMPRYHACWSLGGIAGAALGGLAARFATSVTVHFTVAATASAVLVLAALTSFVDDGEGPDDAADRAHPDTGEGPDTADRAHPDTGAGSGDAGAGAAPAARRRGRVLTPRLLVVGVITLCATTVEGAAADWLALYLVDDRHTTASLAAAGFATFSLAMTAGRFAGTTVTERLGRDGTVRLGGLVSIAGVALTVLGPGLVSAYAGTVLWALGVSLIFPAAISAGGESPVRPADAIAAVATIGYGGFLIGPPLIGVLADHIGLARALLVLPVLAATISVLAPAVRPRGSDLR